MVVASVISQTMFRMVRTWPERMATTGGSNMVDQKRCGPSDNGFMHRLREEVGDGWVEVALIYLRNCS
jgi:hypothetical protein